MILWVVGLLFPLATTGEELNSDPGATGGPGPIIHQFIPTKGPVGTEVTISGENFFGTTGITFGGVAAEFRAGISETALIAIVPAGALSGPVAVTTTNGTFTTSEVFTLTSSSAPIVTEFLPESGPVGARVLISGSNFIAVTEVRFNGISAVFTLLGDSISAEVPPDATTGPITVTAAGGAATSAKPFTVTVLGGPAITSINPTQARVGEIVTILGENLDAAVAVWFNGTQASFNVFGNSILATVPVNAISGPITVVTPKGSALSPVAFSLISAQAPEVYSFTPEVGSTGTPVSITGSNLVNVSEVRFGGAAAEFTRVSNTELQATVPAGATTGAIVVTSPSGTAVSGGVFYIPAKIQSFDPSHGGPGATVRIQGANLAETIAVLFGGANAAFTIVSPVEVRAVVPADAVSGIISLATPAGFANTSSNFLVPPQVTEFNPLSGPEGSEVTIHGFNFLGATSVRFGTLEASFTPVASTALSVLVPNGAINGPITVTTPAGSATTPESFFVGLFGNLGVGLQAVPDSVAVGDFLSYTLTVTNRGPLAAANVVLTDRLPSGAMLVFAPSGSDCVVANGLITCQLGSLPPGAGLSVRMTATILAGPYLTNRVEVVSSTSDPDLTDNVASLVTVLEGAPPPEVSLSASKTGGNILLAWPEPSDGYILEVANHLLTATAWTAVTNAPVVNNGQKRVPLPANANWSYYRLRKP